MVELAEKAKETNPAKEIICASFADYIGFSEAYNSFFIIRGVR